MTLFLLGVSFARMDVKLGQKSGLPVPALLSVCAAKMILLPIVGVFVTRAMIASGLIDPESKVQIFVAIFVSGTPSAIK
jgi:predicted permease